MAQDLIFTALRFHKSLERAERFKQQCLAQCNYYLINPKDALLPFQIRLSYNTGALSWKLISLLEDCEFPLPGAVLQTDDVDGRKYIWYNGDAIANLPGGEWVIQLSVGTEIYYSEPIEISCCLDINDPPDQGDYLLQEDGFKILQENGSGILL